MRTSVDKLATSMRHGVRKARDAIKGPPPPTETEQQAMRAAAEAQRKSRMVNALRYAREGGHRSEGGEEV